ncbi:MAG: nucleoside-diphosphate sugar epimerase [Rhodospirillaceae bacterium]|nr:nucleoside-diphosphate sugar epimerase [Rhodospirillaceae bacterium]
MNVSVDGKKIVLIGGAGFIGHNLALALNQRGAKVEIIDSLQINNLNAFAANVDNIPNRQLYLHLIQDRLERLYAAGITLHTIDARDYQALSPLLGAIGPQIIIQLAAIAHASKANKHPFSTFDHNLRTLENVLDSSRDYVEHFIYLSSSMVYGDFQSGLVVEDTVCEPMGIYGALKFAGEKLVIAYNQVFDVPYTIVRPSALYGERCVSRRVGQIFIERALRGLTLTIHGDGQDYLDFTYVEDFVDGMVKIMENENAKNEILNLTYGASRSILEMVEILKKEFGQVDLQYMPKDNLMPDRGTLSVEKAKRLIGYEPQFPLEIGFVKYIKWYKSLMKSYAHLFEEQKPELKLVGRS